MANLPKGVTPEQIAAFKTSYGENKIKLAELTNENGETMDVVVRVPDRQVYNEYDKWVGSNPGKAREILVNACLLSHKDEVKVNDDLFFSCCYALVELFPLHKAVVKDL